MNGRPDPEPIPAVNVRGKAQWVVPFVGLPRVWVAQGRWILVLLTLAATALMVWMSRFALDSRYDPWGADSLAKNEATA